MTNSWRPATCTQTRRETPTAKSLRLRVEGLGGVLPGQHVDVRLTADDGYQAVRSYSLSATPNGGPDGRPLADDEVELTVEQLPDGEVSPYLVEGLAVGDNLEIRGPIGGWFVWREADPQPVQLIGGGSGVAPLMAILRSRVAGRSPVSMRLMYSARSPETLYYQSELRAMAAHPGMAIDIVYSRVASTEATRPAGRITAADITRDVLEPGIGTVFVCGPNSFVASVTDLLLASGHDASTIRTERFGSS